MGNPRHAPRRNASSQDIFLKRRTPRGIPPEPSVTRARVVTNLGITFLIVSALNLWNWMGADYEARGLPSTLSYKLKLFMIAEGGPLGMLFSGGNFGFGGLIPIGWCIATWLALSAAIRVRHRWTARWTGYSAVLLWCPLGCGWAALAF